MQFNIFNVVGSVVRCGSLYSEVSVLREIFFPALFVVLFFFPTIMSGQNTNTVSTNTTSEEVGQTDTIKTAFVTASAKPSSTLQSAPLQVMAKSDFERLGIRELHEAVKTFSGVQIKDYGGIGGVKTVSVILFFIFATN